MTIPKTYWQIAMAILVLAAGGCSKGTPLPKGDEAKQVAPALNPVQTQVAELRSKVTKWQENRQKLNTLLSSLEKDRKDMLGKLDAFSKSGKAESEIAPEVKILSTELQEIIRQSASYKAKQRDYELAILKSESKLRSIERQLAASEAGVSETDISELTRTMLALDDNLNAQDTVSSVVTELDDSVAKQLAEYRASKDADVSRLQDQIKKQAEMVASKATIIVTVTPPDAKVLVTGNGVTITGSGASRVVTIDNPMGEYRLIATMDGYKPLDMELKPEKGSTRSSVVTLESMKPVVSGNDSLTAPEVSTNVEKAVKPAPKDAALFKGHAYKFVSEVMTWHQAKRRCEDLGGHLATISSKDEDKFVSNLAKKQIKPLGKMDGVWFGATDEEQEGEWKWIDGTEFSFTNWGPGQPNNKQEAEHYLLYFLPGDYWSDQPDRSHQHTAYFVCEWDDPENKLGVNRENSIVGIWRTTDGKESKTFYNNGMFVERDQMGKEINSGNWQKKERAAFEGKLKNGWSIIIEMTTPKKATFTVFDRQTQFVEKKQMIKDDPENQRGVNRGTSISLIQLSSLKGWHTDSATDNPQWENRNGVLKRIGDGPSLISDATFRDFELHLEFILPSRCNSGVFLRGRYEVQLLDSEFRMSDGKPEVPSGQCGAIYGLIAPSKPVYKGPNQWNTLDVRLVGRIVTVRMNNVTIIDEKRITSSTVGAFDKNDEESPGPIIFQAHRGIGAEFRNITITPIQ